MDKSGKKRIVICVAIFVAVAIIAGIIVVVLNGKKEEYRIIKIYELEGEATVSRKDLGDMDAYPDMVLESGDTVALKSGTMTLRLDDDKFVYVEPDTEFQLEATGNASNSKTSIKLIYGAITNEIQNPLSSKSSYEVNTPNSNMAVRGTIYRVYTYFENDVRYTKVSVFNGKVGTQLCYADDTVADQWVMVQKGNEVLVYDDEKNTDYVGDPSPIDYSALPQSVLKLLMQFIENGEDIGLTVDELQQYLNQAAKISDDTSGSYTVTFLYQGKVFGTQEVKSGERATKPSLSPSQTGDWNFDFDQKITGDVTVEWR